MKKVRLLHYTPNPFNGERFAVGAFVTSSNGTLRFVEPERQWGACLKSTEAANFLERTLEVLRENATLELPLRSGRAFAVGDEMEVSVPIADWLERVVFQSRPERRRKNRKKRRELGRLWLKRERVEAWVGGPFKPEGHLYLRGEHLGIRPLSLYAQAGRYGILMEPLDPQRPQFRQDVEKVATRYRLYRDFFTQSGSHRIYAAEELIDRALEDRAKRDSAGLDSEIIKYATFATFVLPGGDEVERRHAKGLKEISNLHFDTNDDEQRSEWVDMLNMFALAQAS